MFTRSTFGALVFCAVLLSPALQAQELDTITSSDGKVNNYCLGGGDDRKVIPYDGLVRNPFKETTHFGCESEGGRTTFMPDLDPAIKDGKLA